MADPRPLQGGCSCGRNHYTIRIPPTTTTTETPQIFFSNSTPHRRAQATPLSAWIRIPLTWYQSTTYAYMPDETPSSIRRVYTSPHEIHCKRHFCGFCGTPLSYWSESPASEAEYISLTLGSLDSGDLRDLEELGLLPKEAVEDAVGEKEMLEGGAVGSGHKEGEGLPWFETLVEESRLGRVRKSWGARQGKDGEKGRFTIEWEIVEWTEGDDDLVTPSKRKFGEVYEADSAMLGN